MSALQYIDHVALSVADLDKSIHWYQTSFPCELIRKERTHAVLRFANIELVLVLPSQEPAHIAYAREDAKTLGELRERIDGKLSTFIADPSGNVVEILEEGKDV